MSDPANDRGAPIRPGEPLDAVLRASRVPPLAEDFADRVLARAADRPGDLPPLRRTADGRTRWRSVRRLTLGVGVFGALAGAAAAAGLFGVLPDRVPAPGELWARIAGPETITLPASVSNVAPPPPGETDAPVAIEGAIDTPEELEEAFRRFDEFRARRTQLRREAGDRRLDGVLERRREKGLPVPTPEQEAALRERLDTFRERREERIGERVETQRDALRASVEAGEGIDREDFLRRPDDPGSGRPILDRLERLRELPPQERREGIRQWRERRDQRLERHIDRVIEEGALAPDPAAPLPHAADTPPGED